MAFTVNDAVAANEFLEFLRTNHSEVTGRERASSMSFSNVFIRKNYWVCHRLLHDPFAILALNFDALAMFVHKDILLMYVYGGKEPPWRMTGGTPLREKRNANIRDNLRARFPRSCSQPGSRK
jgi:hypothetical protein